MRRWRTVSRCVIATHFHVFSHAAPDLAKRRFSFSAQGIQRGVWAKGTKFCDSHCPETFCSAHL
uniref:Uncharacterized protein n=1 Tax=Tetraselmis sp. GSL018 TaxID=582737 RepID=A0A061RC07_9CHLO